MDPQILSYLLAAYLTFTLGTMSPGPNVLAIMETAFRQGRTQSIALALGMASGSLVWGVSSVVGLTIALLGVPSLIKALQIVGAVYLYWLAYKSFKAMGAEKMTAREIPVQTQLIRYYMQGLLIQVTNPKSAITWLVVYSVALAETANKGIGLYVIAGNVALSVIIHVSYGMLFSIQTVRSWYLRNRKRIQLAIGVLFSLLATALLFARLDF